MVARIFVDREKELEYIDRWVNSFPLPGTSVSRRREVLYIIGPKGVGKSALLREYARRSKGVDKIVVYVEFRGPYADVRDLISDIIGQYYEALKQYGGLKNKFVEILVEVLGLVVEKTVGLSVTSIVRAIRSLEHDVSLSMVLRSIEERLARIVCRQGKRLVIIYDEFQNYVKSLVSEPGKYLTVVEVLLNSLSKVQEWGYGFDGDAYSIFIVSSSDYVVYKLISTSSSYQVIHVYNLNELTVQDSIKLLKKLGESYGVVLADKALEYSVEILGGNPAILIRFLSKLRESGNKFVGLDEVREVLSLLVKEEANRLKQLDLEYDICVIQRVLRGSTCVNARELEYMVAKELKETLRLLEEDRALGEARSFLESLLRMNILTWGSGYYCLQNSLVKHALDELCGRY